jgi:hypothetical protein
LTEAGYWLHLLRAVEEAGRRLYLPGRLPGSFYYPGSCCTEQRFSSRWTLPRRCVAKA